MADLLGAYKTREFMVQRLYEDLLGGESDEQMSEDPLSRFVVGVLYPGRATTETSSAEGIDADGLDTTQDGDAGARTTDGQDDPVVALAQVRHPRTMGLTFAVNLERGSRVTLAPTASRYLRSTVGDEPVWSREGLAFEAADLDCSQVGSDRRTLVAGLEMRTVVRSPQDGVVSVTIALVNTAEATWEERPARCWFNPQVYVKAKEGVLCARPDVVVAGLDDDEVHSQRLLFGDVNTYAIGHGCAVEWGASSQAPTELSTTFLPTHELLLSNPGGIAALDLAMSSLAKTTDFSGLAVLADDYERWIEQLDQDVAELSTQDVEALRRHQAEARVAARRIRRGIELLDSDQAIASSFRLMNEAMSEQRSRQEFHRNGGVGDPPSNTDASWRPFQLAFILLNLEGLCEPSSPDRRLADLLWFPTGGGKTEAYLGLVAISIMLRRLRNPNDAGVSVLMRYTLRLLTLQQYQRATGLICALESLRVREIPKSKSISIGLWVGQASTPNTVKDAKKALQAARNGRADVEEDRADPVQLRQCPWCGTELTHENYTIVDDEKMVVRCAFAGCRFRNGLPVNIVDEDVYRERPSLLIATVDKFAMMPWKHEVGALFGTDAKTNGPGSTIPPDLIIQDELHLISGPLGTVVGLYEMAVDAACSRPAPPKVVASTATIRRASAQVKAVFARQARQFPPPGRTQKDSYFAIEASRDEKGSRAYLGVMGAGTSHTTLMVRVYASLLQSAAAVQEESDDADLYWTLLGYFNSLRVLGGAYMQVIDDVPGHMHVIAERRNEKVRELDQPREMTSRKKSSEIPEELEILERHRGDDQAADVVLATNMISVGVDVDRLGLMAVMGQPQTSSEYIQATSRVGRRRPGLVVTVYNAARTRDLSHFENFTGYHQMIYRHVEATGATPLAPRARDRALHGVLVSMARLLIPEAMPDGSAGAAVDWEHELQSIASRIVDRAEQILENEEVYPPDESPDVIEDELNELIERWLSDESLTHYAGWYDRKVGALLKDASSVVADHDDEANFPVTDPPWPTLTSMRDVDAESKLFLVRRRRNRGK
ncbi:helicase-related protein [Janibacter cremeus]|uniref:helicase-related protein n=1 Tax=Janibacter cremeus TaxID=1285192 RepID=UPI0023F65581|nr:helicase-related protein [Janibacter cremeus]WEV78611.1 helicase-related protein [Janibacter cremeus]